MSEAKFITLNFESELALRALTDTIASVVKTRIFLKQFNIHKKIKIKSKQKFSF